MWSYQHSPESSILYSTYTCSISLRDSFIQCSTIVVISELLSLHGIAKTSVSTCIYHCTFDWKGKYYMREMNCALIGYGVFIEISPGISKLFFSFWSFSASFLMSGFAFIAFSMLVYPFALTLVQPTKTLFQNTWFEV